MKHFGKRLHKAAREAGLTRKDLSERLGVSERTIAYWWNDERIPDALQLKEYAEITTKPILYFYNLEGSMEQTKQVTIPIEEYNKLRDDYIREKSRADQLEKTVNKLIEKTKGSKQ